MSIAVSATILPSRFLSRMLVFMFALANATIGYAGFCVGVNQIAILVIFLVSGLLSLTIFLRYSRRRCPVRLDISDSGEIIFRILTANQSHLVSLNVKLSEKSTLWPHIMLLTLSSDGGQNFVLPILQDSVDAAAYRKLSVALIWIAMHTSTKTIFDANMPSGNF